MNGTLRLRNGPGGPSAGPYPADLGVTLGIGDTEPVTIALDSAVKVTELGFGGALVREAEVDVVMVAGRYTLLDERAPYW